MEFNVRFDPGEKEFPVAFEEIQVVHIREEATDAVRYTPQDLTDEQKAQARENIGAEEVGKGGGSVVADAVTYTAQTLTDMQKAQARTNIGAQEIIVLEDLTSQIVLNHPDLITEQLFSFFKYGRICMFTVQIIVSGTVNDNYGFTVATLPVRCAHRVWINNGTQFYMEKGSNTIRRNGSDLPAGNYMMSGFYISKE